MTGIVCIHGMGGSAKDYQPIIHYLEQHNIRGVYGYEYQLNRGETGITTLAHDAAQFISNLPHKEIILIGISQGGIIASLLTEFIKPKAIKAVITVSTPFQGSILAQLVNRPGMVDLRKHSAVLTNIENALSSTKVPYYAVYNVLDTVVVPGISGKNQYAKERVKLMRLSHVAAFVAQKTKKSILKWVQTEIS